MSLRYLLIGLTAVLMVLSCSKENPAGGDGGPGPEVPGEEDITCEENFQKGVLRLKFADDEAAAYFTSEEGIPSRPGFVRMERTFPDAGEFEARTRAEGLHLWYDVYFDEEVDTKASSDFDDLDGISVVERRPSLKDLSDEFVEVQGPVVCTLSDGSAIFNDPMFAEQWHYFNDGSNPGSIAGADINVLPVWKDYTTGSQDVVVCVVDGGIDCAHEDLAANMWSGKAPDGSTIHGFNFVNDTYEIEPTQHGTHVAGTVAAVNNNGIGVCGVAGGDAAHNIPGVRLMSCQILSETDDTPGNGARAIKWGADHGAVICQNSWGYTDEARLEDTPQSDKEAIEYFIKYAGMDAEGKQVGPMAGGIVIFAAGNSGRKIAYPASYEPCVAVSAISWDFDAATYTNYGQWTDIIAPGGEAIRQCYIYSTLPGNKYGISQGTSMACPHVSGVAALLVSYFGGPGFTPVKLREMMESSLTDISSYAPYIYIGKGLLNAEGAFSAF